jgi:hypothetical protein
MTHVLAVILVVEVGVLAVVALITGFPFRR